MSGQSLAQAPALPALYFSHESTSRRQRALFEEAEQPPSLSILPPELLNDCLIKYADWGDLAKLACVRSKWKNVVADAAEFGGRDAMWELSMCLLGRDGHADVKSTTENATGGNSDRSTKRNTRGLQKNEALAIKYLSRLSGVGVDKTLSFPSSEESADSFLPDTLKSLNNVAKRNAADADEAAILQLAECHLAGTGLPAPDPIHALYLLQLAYHLTNSTQSAHKLALLYGYPEQSSSLIPVDVVAAYEWFKAAANLGCVASMAELALCYELGCGVAQSDTASLDWYTKAANAGHAASYYSVGEHFEEARGVPLDHEEACVWYWKAARCGEEEGVDGLRRLKDVARRVLSEEEAEAVFNA